MPEDRFADAFAQHHVRREHRHGLQMRPPVDPFLVRSQESPDIVHELAHLEDNVASAGLRLEVEEWRRLEKDAARQ